MIAVLALMSSIFDYGQDRVEFEKREGEIEVLLGGERFATIRYADRSRPHVYPVFGPSGIQMLRSYPFVKGVAGEADDHPHHTGVWYGHGDMNGVDVWSQKGSMEIIEPPLITGSTVTLKLKVMDSDGGGRGLCAQSITFGQVDEAARFIDYDVLLSPSPGKSFTLGDTKEGTMGVRTHPNLRLTRPDKNLPTGRVINSEGLGGREVWGKRAKWIDYWGEISDETVGIAMFDHPGNPRHPTWWHARDYGLFAANPFGVSAFEYREKGAGRMELEVNETVRFRYRILLHTGTAESAGIEGHYRQWANGK